MKFSGFEGGEAEPAAEGGLEGSSEIILLRRQYGEKVHPLSTDRFLAASKAYYSRPPWLAREIAQNFVDHNPGENRGTLKGVSINVEDVPDAPGTRRITITGSWPFRSNTGLTTMHSEKPEEGESAGGNGIGLKQTALIFIRDFAASRFEVDGEGWRVGYRIIPGEESGLPHNWFVAEEKSGGSKGSNSYVIETDNTAVVEALEELPNIAVGPDNEFLQDLDFENEHGAIKWLVPEENHKPGIGRLFLNGQVMDVSGGPDSKGWQGMRGLTLRLNNVQYGRNMDRPPVYPFSVGTYAHKFFDSMKSEELVSQIAASEKIWSAKDNKDWESLEVLKVVVRRLSSEAQFGKGKDQAKEVLQRLKEYFVEKKYVARNENVGTKFEKKLEDQGYILCPKFLEDIGMPSVMELSDSADMAASQVPDPAMARYKRERAAEESGVEVAYQNMGHLSPEKFAKELKERLLSYMDRAVLSEDKLKVELSTAIPESFLTKVSLKGSSPAEQLLGAVRDLAANGLLSGVLKQAVLFHKEGMVTFGVDRSDSSLLVRILKGGAGTVEGSRFEVGFDPEFSGIFKNIDKETAKAAKALSSSSDNKGAWETTPRDPKEVFPERTASKKFALAASLAAALAVAGWFGLGDRKESKGGDNKARTRTLLTERTEAPSPTSEEYSRWKADRTRRLTEYVNYPGGRSLEDILGAYNRANVPPGAPGRPSEEEAPQMSDPVRNFEILREPSMEQLERMIILRESFYLLTGYEVDNQLFIFRGEGAKGVNIGRDGLGVHEEVINGDFQEALNTFIHEAAHNNPNTAGHDPEFQATTAALTGQAIERLMIAMDKADQGESLTASERRLVDLRRGWNGS